MSLLRAALLATTLALSAPAVVFAAPARLDGVAAIVGASSLSPGVVVVLWSDVELEVFLERARARADLAPAASSSERDAARERLIGRALLVNEASRMRMDDVDEGRKSTEWRRLFDQLGGARVVDQVGVRVGVVDGELDRYVELEAIERGFVLASADQGGLVTESELEAAYEEGQHPFVGMPLDSVREALRAWLLDRRVRTETERWVALLRERVVVRRNRLG